MRKGNSNGLKRVLKIYMGIVLILAITCIVVYIIYNNKVKEATRQSILTTEKMEEIVPNIGFIEEASTELSKTIGEAIAETEKEVDKNIEKIETNENLEENISQNINTENIIAETPKKELVFIYPVEGEIQKEFSIENLVFSETLQEWIVHKGIDIKAPRTTIVKSAEEGTIQAIKSDPRYGLTVIIEHIDGYKTIYANLLTTEFVEEGEKVEKGQTIGTVGNSAAFEIADEPHLHFEITKDETNVDPKLYLK